MEAKVKDEKRCSKKKTLISTKKAYKVIKGLREQNAKLHTDEKTAQRKLLRMKKKISSDTKAARSLTLPAATTPNSKTNFEMRKQGLSPSENPLIKRKISI